MTFTLRENKLEKAKNIRLGYKGLSRTSAQAHLRGASYTKKIQFLILIPGVNITKLFSLLLTLWDKLEYAKNIRLDNKGLSGPITLACLQDECSSVEDFVC